MRLQVRKMLDTSFAAGVFLRRCITVGRFVKKVPSPPVISSHLKRIGPEVVGCLTLRTKVVYGKEEQVVREITQAARRKCCLALGWVGAAAESVQNWRTYV